MPLVLPALDAFPPLKFHDQLDKIVEACNDYILQNWPFRNESDRQSYLDIQISHLGAAIVPYASSVEKTVLFCILMTFFTLLDDFIDRGEVNPEDNGALKKLLPPPYESLNVPLNDKKEKSINDMVQDIWFKVGRSCSHEEYNSIAEGTLAVLRAQRNSEATNIEEYLEARRLQIGTPLIYPMMRFAMDIYPSKDDLSSALIIECEVLAGKAAVLQNDICSWEREKLAGENNNAIFKLMRWSNLSEEAAVKDTTNLNRQIEMRLWNIINEVTDKSISNDVRAYLIGVAYMVGANAWFFKNSSRYRVLGPQVV